MSRYVRDLLIALILGVSSSAAVGAVLTFDLAGDWSDASNPNGTWAYHADSALGTSRIRGGDSFGVAPLAWGNGPGFAGWSRSNGTEMFAHDWSAGMFSRTL